MQTILILNTKGGCGKSTVATNLAAYYAGQGQRVTLADCDVQGSSADWLANRPEHFPGITGINQKDHTLQIPADTEILIMDTPAGLHGKKLGKFVKVANFLIIPVLPSAIDIRATDRFLKELYTQRKFINRKIKIASIANRVREDTLAAAKVEYFLDHINLPDGKKLPYKTMLRASQNYINAAEKGISIFELPPSKTYYDREQWKPLINWLNRYM